MRKRNGTFSGQAAWIALLAVLSLSAMPAWAQRNQAKASGPTNFVERPAIFEVTTDVVNEDLEAFTITAGAFGNSVLRVSGGFEPVNYRDLIRANQDSPDRVYSNNLDKWDTRGSGYMDGADVRVYRVINGKMQIVRTDKIVDGGTVVAGWNKNEQKPVKPESTEYYFKWTDWSRPDSDRWFTIFAMDKEGNLSDPATPVRVRRPEGDAKGKTPNNTTNFRKPRRSSGDTQAPPQPQNLKATVQDDGVVKFTWSPVQADDLAGYVFARSDVDPREHKGFYLQLADSPADPEKHIKDGDMIIASTVYRQFDPAMYSVRIGNLWRVTKENYPDLIPDKFYPNAIPGKGWRLVDHAVNTPVEDGGQTYLEMTLREGDSETLGGYILGNTEQDWYYVPHSDVPYVIEFWAKADGVDAPPIVFETTGSRDGAPMPRQEFKATTQWRRFRKEVKATPPDNSVGRIHLTFSGPATYSIDNFRIYRADTPFLDYPPEIYERLKKSGMSAFRTHGPIKTGTTTYDMAQFTNPPGVLQGVRKANTLDQQFKMMEKAEIDPWLQIEMHMSPEEWLGFVEYIAAPYDPARDTPESKPWAYKRYKQGREKPWTDAFDRIYFEISNETWNWLFSPWVFESMTDAATGEKYDRGRVYGMFNEHIIEIFRSSPYWNDEIENKFVYMIGGWSRSNYGWEAVQGSPSSHFQLIAAYNGGWDEGEGPPQVNPASFFNALGQVYQSAVHTARLNAERLVEHRKQHDPNLRLGTYEAGPGYALNGLNGAKVSAKQAAEQEKVMKSKAAGTATLDSFLMRAYYDFDSQNFFTFSEGRTWSSHTKWYRGGQSYPCFMTLELFNHQGQGDMLSTKMESVATVDTPKSRRRIATQNAPLAMVYATRDGQRVNLFCISRRFPGYPEAEDDGYTEMTVKLPFSKAEKVSLYRLTGEPSDNNIMEDIIEIEEVAVGENMSGLSQFKINDKTGGDAKGLPPGETYLYVFEGTDIGPEGKKLSLEEVLVQPTT
ncbi:MAG: hypothetical protein ACLFUS_14525, partial [Candidatus Sumerlaeia bacterium]